MKKYIFLSFLIVFSFICINSTFAYNGKRVHFYLDNGMEVVISEVPTSPIVAVYGFVKTGSATEGKYLGTGISHYLEHMLFKGTKNRGVGEVAGEIQSLGGNINAATSKDYTNYTITVPYEHFDQGLDVLADMIMNATIDAKEAESEKEVIINEMRMHNDRPRRFLHNLVFESVYKVHPYRHPTIGYPDVFEKVTHKELYDYYKKHYAPNNMILSIAGNIKIDEITPKIKEKFKDFERQSYAVRNLPKEPVQLSTRYVERSYPTQVTRVLMAYYSVALLDKDLYALDVLAGILGAGKSSRLHKELFDERQIVYGVSAGNYTPYDPGIFQIEFSLDYENLDETMKEIKRQIKLVQDKGVSEKELSRIKNQTAADHVYYSQSAREIAHQQVMDAAFAADFRFSDKYVEGIQAVSLADIKRVAKAYLTEHGLTTVVLYPEGVKKEDKAAHTTAQVKQRVTSRLSNGVKLLVQENPAFDLVNLSVAFEGGIRYEPADQIGISNMVAALIRRGTKKYSLDKIHDMYESRGMSVGGFSGRNSLGLRFQFLPQDLDIALELMEEFVEHPTFPQEEIDKLKKSNLISIKNRKDNPFTYSRELLEEYLFKAHPYQFRMGGYENTVTGITRDDLLGFYNKVIAPENMIISVIGNVSTQEITEKIEKRLASFKPRGFNKLEHTVDPINERQYRHIALPKEQAVVIYGFRGPTLSSEDRYKVEVLTAILGSSFNGRMFTKIRDKLGKAYALGGYDMPGVDVGGIYFYVMTNADSVEKVKELLDREIVDLQKNLVTDKELTDTKTYLKGDFNESIEKTGSLNYLVVLDELYGLGAEHHTQYKNYIDAVTADEVKTMANKYLVLDKSVVVTALPEDQE